MTEIETEKSLHQYAEGHGRVYGRALILGAVVTAGALALPRPAAAVPSYATQTGQPCAACHIGSFGPQLTQYGRDFKLFGYTASNHKPHLPALAAMVETSFTRTSTDVTPPPKWFGPNNNFSLDQVSLFYGGSVVPDWVGAFVQATYDGVHRQIHWDNTDIRLAHDTSIGNTDVVYGATINNNPTVQDLWNSTPAWGYPYVSTAFVPGGAAKTLIDGGLAQNVLGGGLYTMIANWIYLEGDVYQQPSTTFLKAGGIPTSRTDTFDGAIPYWRAAIQHSFDHDHHNIELGTFGLIADKHPGGNTSTGQTDHLVDWAGDVSYQWYRNPTDVTADIFSAHATYINEHQDLNASTILSGTNPKNTVETARADLSYSIDATWTPSVQYFKTWGTKDPALYGPTGNPETSGFKFEVAYSPFGKPDSPTVWFNPHITAQYTAFNKFNGVQAGAGDNNAFMLNIWFALGMPR